MKKLIIILLIFYASVTSADTLILSEDWEDWTTGTGRGSTEWDCDGTSWGDSTIGTPARDTKALQLESSDYGNWTIGLGDHPLCNNGGAMITDLTVQEYVYLSSGFQWPTTSLKFWIINAFEAWGAGYDEAEGEAKPNTWAPYYLTIAANSSGELYGNLTRADGLGGTGDLWHNYLQNEGSAVALTAGEWHKIKFRLKLNTPGESDGIFQLWINDVLKCNYSSMNFRGTYTDYGWNHFMMMIYAGPSHPQSQSVSRDDINIYSGTSATFNGVTIVGGTIQ